MKLYVSENATMSRPEHKIRIGPVTASIFAQGRVVEGEMVKFHSITFDKAYREGDTWKHTSSFAPEDLPKVALLATEAYKRLRVKVSDDEAVGHE
jgi:hypothetical protein